MQLPGRSKENLWHEIESKMKNDNGVSPLLVTGEVADLGPL